MALILWLIIICVICFSVLGSGFALMFIVCVVLGFILGINKKV